MMTVSGATLREVRRILDISQCQCAKALGVSQSVLVTVERGHTEPSPPLGIKMTAWVRKNKPKVKAKLKELTSALDDIG